MLSMQSHHVASSSCDVGSLLPALLVAASLFQQVSAANSPSHELRWRVNFMRETRDRAQTRRGFPPLGSWQGKIPMVITNKCADTIWPGIITQAGTGPGTGGFALEPGTHQSLWVSEDWQGRIWGRTNCTGEDDSWKCKTGDCLGKLSCEQSGETPATLAEFNLAGGVDGSQTFYDISLVDGYNIPMGINYIPGRNTTFIPPNLTNCACIATPGWLYDSTPTGTFYSNSSFPMPLETKETNRDLQNWCPWPLLAFPPKRPGDGIYPYPDDNIQRPNFSPCFSACAKTGSDKDCCSGKYDKPDVCKPSGYSKAAKAMCPDAYSYAFDDKSSTFIIPKGGGWEIVMCPKGRSTNIIRQLGPEMDELNRNGKLSASSRRKLSNATYIATDKGAADSSARPAGTLAALMVTIAISLLLAL